MTIKFTDNITYPVLSIMGRTELVSSLPDLIAKSDRNIMEIHFDSTVLDKDGVFLYYKNATELTHIITIVDDKGQTYTHLDYVIPVKYSLEYFGNETNPRIVLVLAQLTETDKSLREVAGMTKVYTGTELEIAIAKKVDEVSKDCNIAIEAGVDYNGEHYSLTDEDRDNILAWGNRASKGFYVPYHADGKHCRPYSPQDFTGLVEAAVGHIAHHATYCNLLMRWIETLTDVNEISTVVYGKTELTGVYLDEYNTNIALLVSGEVDNNTGESGEEVIEEVTGE